MRNYKECHGFVYYTHQLAALAGSNCCYCTKQDYSVRQVFQHTMQKNISHHLLMNSFILKT